MGVPIGWTSLKALDIMEWRRWNDAFSTQGTSDEAVSHVSKSDDTATLEQREARRDIQEKKVLQFSMLRELDNEGRDSEYRNVAEKSATDVSSVSLRKVQGENESATTPSGQESPEQYSSQYRRSLLALSHDSSHRVSRLKALGNGVVPIVVKEFLWRIGAI